MPYVNLWTTNHPVAGNNQAKDLDDAIRRVRVDVMERLLSIIGGGALATDDPINPANATTAALKTVMDALSASNVTASGLSAGVMAQANGATSLVRLDAPQAFTNDINAGSNFGVYAAAVNKMINVITSSAGGSGGTITINTVGSALGDTLFYIILRAGGGSIFASTVNWSAKYVFNGVAPTTGFPSGKQIAILFWYDLSADKAFEIARSGQVTY